MNILKKFDFNILKERWYLQLLKIIKNQLLIIIVFLLRFIKLSFPLIFVLIFNFNNHKFLSSIALLFYGLLIIGYSFLKWNNINLTLDKKNINYESGLFFKKLIKIPLNNLTIIKTKQDLMQKIFSICTYKLSDGNISGKNSKISMIFKNNIAFNIENLIKNYKYLNISTKKDSFDINKNKLIFKITKKELLVFAVTGNNIAFGIGIIFTTKEFLKKLDRYLNFHITKIPNPLIKFKLMYDNYGIHIIYIIFLILIIFFILSTLMSIIQKFIKFYDFTIYKNNKNIIIKFGLISKNKYTIPIESILAIKLKQNFIKQIFKLYKIEICTIGYGQGKDEQAILYPIANNTKTIKILKELFTEFNNDIDIIKPPKRAFSNFLVLPISIFLMFYLIVTILNSKFKILIFLFPILILSRYLNYKNISIAFNRSIFLGVNGGFYRNILILKTFKIESIEKKSSYFQSRKQLASYKINYPNGNINLKHLDEKILKSLKKYLI